jgi:hypothetical protein
MTDVPEFDPDPTFADNPDLEHLPDDLIPEDEETEP